MAVAAPTYPMMNYRTIPQGASQYATGSTVAAPVYQIPPTLPHAAYVGAGAVQQAGQAANDDEDNKDMMTDLAVAGGEMAAWALPKVGIAAPVATAFSAFGAGRAADKGVEGMVNAYREIIAADLNIHPSQVNEAALRKSAEHLEPLKDALEAYDDTRTDRPLESLAGAGAAGAAALSFASSGAAVAAGGAAVATGGTSLLITLPVGFAASWLGEKAASGLLGSKDVEDTAHGYVQETLKPKLESGQGLSSVDIFSAYVKMDDQLAQQIETSAGDNWDDLDTTEKASTLLKNHPKMARICAQEAYLCNTGALTPEMVLFAEPAQIEQTMQIAQQRPQMHVQKSYPAQVGMMPQAVMNQQATNQPMHPPMPQIMTSGAQVQPMMLQQVQR